nr:MAG TPA: hypothetical protein [Caudoviricetes sp.]
MFPLRPKPKNRQPNHIAGQRLNNRRSHIPDIFPFSDGLSGQNANEMCAAATAHGVKQACFNGAGQSNRSNSK